MSQVFAEDGLMLADGAKQVTVEWVEKLNDDEIKYAVAEKDAVFQMRFSPGTPRGDLTALTLRNETSSTTIAFKGKVTEDLSVEQLNARLLYVAMDKIATPGLKIEGWELRLMTSVSSFKEGVKVVSFENGQLTFTVKNKCFAISGRQKNLLVPADAPMPKHAYFRVTKNIPINITISANLTAKAKPPGNMVLPKGFVHTPLKGIDSQLGEIAKEGGLKINYEIGRIVPKGQPRTGGSFSDRAVNLPAAQRDWFRSSKVKGKLVNMAYGKNGILLVSFPEQGINFSAKVKGEEQITKALNVILTYP